MSARKLFLPACLALVVLCFGCNKEEPPPAPVAPERLQQVALEDLQKVIAEAAAAHQVLVLDFWATWCDPCIEIFPGLHNGIEKLGPGVRQVSITLDAPGKGEVNAIAFLKKNGAMKDALMLVPGADERLRVVHGVGKEWNSLVVPAILIYDQSGKLDHEFLGDVLVEPMLVRVKELLQSNPVATRP